MPLIPIDDLNDPRLEPYRDLRDKDLLQGGAREGRFIAEQWLVVEQLLRRPSAVASVLCSERMLARLKPEDVDRFDVLLLSESQFEALLGFAFHRGILALGRREGIEARDLESLLATAPKNARWLCCERISHIDNIGALFRIAAAFGVHGVLICEQSCDPLYRRSLRVGVGHALHIPWVRSRNWHADLERLRTHGFALFGAALGENSLPFRRLQAPPRLALLVGHEGHGLSQETLAHCDQRVQIPMADGVDSLNVGVAAAVLLAHFQVEEAAGDR